VIIAAYLLLQVGGFFVGQCLTSGGKEAALKALNEQTPPMPALKANHIIPQQERMAALAIINDTDGIMREIQQHQGKLNLTAQVHGIALLGARVRGVREASEQLSALAAKMEQEGGALMGAVKTKLKTFADLAKALDDVPLPPESGTAARRLSASEGPMSRLVVMAALAKATERVGGDASDLRSKIRESTAAFDN
jgi:hypothetical protein